MYKPSGIAIVTAGLAALALFHVIWGRDPRQAEPWPQGDAPTHTAGIDPAATFLLHSGAWRAWPAPVEEEPARAPVAQSAPDLPAGVSASAAMVPNQSAPIEPSSAPPSVLTPGMPSGFVTSSEPTPPPPAEAPTPMTPASEERMALAGPKDHEAPAPVAQVGRSAPRTHDHASAIATPAPAESKFGPAIFRQFERNGF
jgi:hypothetical protein